MCHGRSLSRCLCLLVVLVIPTALPAQDTGKKKLTPEDARRIMRVGTAALSPDGKWVSYTERGGGSRGVPAGVSRGRSRNVSKFFLRAVDGPERHEFEGAGLRFSDDSRWAGWATNPPRPPRRTPTKKSEESKGKPKQAEGAGQKSPAPKGGAASGKPKAEIGKSAARKPATRKAAETSGGAEPGGGRRRGAGASSGGAGSRWLEQLRQWRLRRSGGEAGQDDGKKSSASRGRGSLLTLRNLEDARTIQLKNVGNWQFVSGGTQLLYTWTPAKDADHGVYLLDLTGDVSGARGKEIVKGKARYTRVAFDEGERYLTFWSNLPHPNAVRKPEPPIAATKPRAPRSSGETAAKPVTATGKKGAEKPAVATAKKKPGGKSRNAARSKVEKKDEPKEPTRLWQWDRETHALSVVYGPESKGYPKDHEVVAGSSTFSPDRRRLFVSFRPKPKPKPGAAATESPEEEETREVELPSGRKIRLPASQARRMSERRSGGSRGPRRENDVAGEKKKDEARLDIWHWKDAQIATMRNRRRSSGPSRSLLHAVDLESGDIVVLGHERLRPSLNKTTTWALASDDDPYTAERTWDRSYSDWYVIDARDGSRRRVIAHTARAPRFSPDGSTILAFDESQRVWFAIDPATLDKMKLDVDPGQGDDSRGVPSAGRFGRMLPGDRALIWSDGKDLWSVPLDGSPSRNLTRTGRRDGMTFSHLILDSAAPFGATEDRMWLSSVNDRTKAEGIHALNLRTLAMETLLCMDKDVGRPIKAKDADRYVVSVSSSQHPADLWIADAKLGKMRRLTDANPWLEEYAIPKTEIIEWRNTDGDPLQGILVKPVGYQPGKRYPTIVYIYEMQSSGLHRFRTPGTQLNPQTWAQNGYAVFMPDITYQIGKPGMSSVRCVVPGVQKLIDLGIADADRLGLCGHSWGGYETAYIITQTKMFKAAISGAPVVNMTSAYGGIRWSTGLPRQFQYERTQSRIGGSLWEYPERYIENSPLFHLENVVTPTLIMFGNRDGAVPWYQGIEFYLGLRRLGKECVFLEYKDEDHGLRRRPNQQDYHKRIMQWWDHYLKGVAAPEWIVGPKSVEPLGDTEPMVPAANGN